MTKKAVSERALLARINRKLAKDDQKLLKCRADTRAHTELGDWYIVRQSTNSVEAVQVDLEQLAQELKCIRSFEALS